MILLPRRVSHKPKKVKNGKQAIVMVITINPFLNRRLWIKAANYVTRDARGNAWVNLSLKKF